MTNLERWRFYLQDIESPDLYINWTFYFLIGATLQRRVCLEEWPHQVNSSPLFPNQYLIFVGPSRVGKSTAADKGLDLFYTFGGFEDISQEEQDRRLITIGPSSASLEGIYKYMAENLKVRKLPEQFKNDKGKDKFYPSTPLAFFATKELATLFREHTDDTIHFLSQGWECGDFHRITKGAGIDFIKAMCVSLFGCGTPDWIRDISKSGLLKAGFAARTIFVWGGKPRFKKLLYKFGPEQKAAFEEIRKHIIELSKLYGPMKMSPETLEYITDWYEKGGSDVRVNHAKVLEDYYANKKLLALKTAMAMHFENKLTLELEIEDFKRALKLLEETEQEMHLALLGTSTENPSARVAGIIEQQLILGANGSPWIREGFLLRDTFSYCPEGRATFDEAIQFLIDTNKIRSGVENGKTHYRLTTQEERKRDEDRH